MSITHFEDHVKIGEEVITDEKLIKELKRTIENYRSPLGKTSEYVDKYDSSLLYPISRKQSRDLIGNSNIKMYGADLWNDYEFSGLLSNGKPFSKTLRIIYDCNSENIVESKSLKLYMNSLNSTKFRSVEESIEIIKKDLKELLKCNYIDVEVVTKEKIGDSLFMESNASTLDLDNIKLGEEILSYEYNPSLLKREEKNVEGREYVGDFYTRSFKSNCRKSGLPDWATVCISYRPDKYVIDFESLYRYLISYRNMKEFHEECIERIMFDLVNLLEPKTLIVLGQYTRRGGIDINPFRVYLKPELENTVFSDSPLKENSFLKTIFKRNLQQ